MGEPTTPKLSGTEQAAAVLATVNMLAGALPLLIASGGLVVRMIAALLRHHGVSIAPFADEIARLDNGIGNLNAAVAEFRQIATDAPPAAAPPSEG